MKSIWPERRSFTAGASPLYGTWLVSMPTVVLNSSEAIWIRLPLPAEP